MNRNKSTLFFIVITGLSITGIFFSSCKEKLREGMIVFTQVAGEHSRLVAMDPEKAGKSIRVISTGFYSARSPEVSFDGRSLLFSAQQKENDPWQIWEMNLRNSKCKRVTSPDENCVDPAYLPGGRVVYSRVSGDQKADRGNALFTCNLDGSDARQITFNPQTYLASAVLKDGRILTLNRQVYPGPGNTILLVLRPDGTKAELFYKGMEGSALKGRVSETSTGKLVFIESDKINPEKGNIISVSYSQPLHSRVNLTQDNPGDFHSVFSMLSGKLLVSFRPAGGDRFAIYEFDPENKVLGRTVYHDPDFDATEAVVIEKQERPRKLPSEVDMGVQTGLLLCQDINFFGMHTTVKDSSLQKTYRIEILGIDSTFGIVEVAKDGSFYLKVIADTPFRIQTVDKDGHVLHGPCEWTYLRPNERRGCVGCHEDPEMVPENRLPLSVKTSPVNVPVHISKIKDKDIELE